MFYSWLNQSTTNRSHSADFVDGQAYPKTAITDGALLDRLQMLPCTLTLPSKLIKAIHGMIE
jgi:hypothetical protein